MRFAVVAVSAALCGVGGVCRVVSNAWADSCPALKVPVPAKLELTSKHDAPIPDVIDFGDTSLDPFFEKLAQVARGKQAILRIGTYGDSNWTNDKTAGEIRRRLQLLFGDAGHGFVAFGIPWGWYHHQNAQHGTTGTWTMWNIATNETRDQLYGFAGISAESTQTGATAWVETAKAGDPIGTSVSAFELWYLARPKGGSFEVLIDKESKQIVETENATPEMKYLTLPVVDGPHRLTVKVKKGRVRLFGVTLERGTTGVVVDGIGINALSALTMTRMNPANQSEGLRKRNYDLLIETTGTNMWSPQRHLPALEKHVAQWRAALPKGSFMLWSPPDFVGEGTQVSVARMRQCAKEKHDAAKANGIGYWDQYEALGGWGSMPKWARDRWSEPDMVHFGPKMNAYVGERFVYAVLKELAKRVEKNPKLGCSAR